MVHVGERVEFDFVLRDALNRFVPPDGLADYSTATIGSKRVETVPDPLGHFSFSHVFDDTAPGEQITVAVSAFRQRGERDYMRVGEQWLAADSPFAEPDKKGPGDSVRLTVYRSVVELELPRPPDDFDPQTGVLRLRRLDGTTTSVYLQRSGRHGFALRGPEPDGRYRITYYPKGHEVNPTGKTDVTFTIYDVSGRRHVKTLQIDTP